MAVGNDEEIDNMMDEQNQMLEHQKNLQNKIVDTQTKQQVDRLNYNKEEQQKEAEKEASALYTNYKKQSQQYGVNQEQLVAQGLANSGYAESTKTALYNEYQSNVTEVMNTNSKLKAEFDMSINEAYQNADVQKAQNELSLFSQKSNLLLQEYTLKYQKYRDDVADEQFERQMALQERNEEQSQKNWEKEYALSLEKSRRSS